MRFESSTQEDVHILHDDEWECITQKIFQFVKKVITFYFSDQIFLSLS
jgi:hypothetical protein